MLNEQSYPFMIKIYLCNEIKRKYLIINLDPVRDVTGYRPGYLVNRDIDKWLRQNIGPGQHGSALPAESIAHTYKNHLVNQKWWHSWSYSHDPYNCHYIDVHFKYEEDAVAFKLRWF